MSQTSPASLPSYDEVLYTDLPFAQSHPSRLAAMGRLFGVEPPPVATARVLELGCALGGNLIPMAVAMPDAQLLGIDLSVRQIDEGNRVVKTIGLSNIELRHADIADVDGSYGRFDYIVAHGIYSWVPPAIRDKVLAICAANLATNGVAYVSYNVMPGWAIKRVARDAMLYHSRHAQTEPERIGLARGALEFLSQHLPPDTPYAAVIRNDLDGLAGVADAYLRHDHLESDNEAFYFHEFVDAASRHQLRYLAEADFSAMAPLIPSDLKEALRQVAPDLVAREQYLDFLHHRSFRQTLLVHADAPINRRLEPSVLQRFDFASPIHPVSSSMSLAQGVNEMFRTQSGAEASTPSAISKAALLELGAAWPAALPFGLLLERARDLLGSARNASMAPDQDARTLAIEMLQCYAGAAIELRTWSPALAIDAGELPLATPLARLQALRGAEVTNLLHRSVAMNPFGRALLPLLDGTRRRPAIVDALMRRIDAGEIVVPVRPGGVVALVDETLNGLAKAALLSSDDAKEPER